MMDVHRVFANLDGENISCTYIPLTRREAWEVEYNTLGTIAAALCNAAPYIMALFQQSAKGVSKDIENTSHIARAVHAVHSAVPFPVLYDVAKKILRGAVIDRDGFTAVIEELDESNYFDDRLDELLLATFWGLDVSFPRAFTKARAFLDVLKGEEKDPGTNTLTGSNTQSAESKPNSSQRHASTG